MRLAPILRTDPPAPPLRTAPGILTGLLVAVLAAGALPAQDALVWDASDLVVDPDIINLAAQVSFHARNLGTSTIHLSDVRPSCGCLIPILDQSPLSADPGEGITLPVMVILADRPLVARHEISGLIHGMAQTPFHLRLTVYGEPGLSVAPDAVFWPVGESPAQPRVVHIILPTEDAIEDEDPLSYDASLLRASIQDVTPAPLWDEGWRKHYDLEVTPLGKPAHGITWADVRVATPRGQHSIRIYTQWK